VDTLLTKPGDFGKQLSGTIHARCSSPLPRASANLTRTRSSPSSTARMHGGISGMFGGVFGRQDPIKTATDQNTLATRQNSQAMYQLSELLARASAIDLVSRYSAILPARGILPRFGEGGITNGRASLARMPELVIPLSKLLNSHRRHSGPLWPTSRGEATPSPGVGRDRAAARAPRLALGGMMPLLLATVERSPAQARRPAARRDAGRPRRVGSAPEEGGAFSTSTYEELKPSAARAAGSPA